MLWGVSYIKVIANYSNRLKKAESESGQIIVRLPLRS